MFTSEWKQIVENGHELGTIRYFIHVMVVFDWGTPNMNANNYYLEQIRRNIYSQTPYFKSCDGKNP